MDKTCSRQSQADSATQNPRKRKRKHKGVDSLRADRQNATCSNGIDKFPDDILVAILSCMSFKEAARTSLLSRRWRYLWMFTSGTLEFEDMDIATGSKIMWKESKARVNRFLKLHQVRERSYCRYEFPSIDKLLPHTHEVKPVFGSLRSLRFVYVDIKDEVVLYFLASCPYLEQLCIKASYFTKNLQVVDPLPNLRVMEISKCCRIQSLEVSAMNLVSFTFDGNEISLPFKKIPNVFELSLGGGFCRSFMCEPNKYLSYSVQLVKLALNLETSVRRKRLFVPRYLPQLQSLKRLELKIVSQVGRGLLFFASLVKASRFLHEFKIKISYMVDQPWYMTSYMMLCSSNYKEFTQPKT